MRDKSLTSILALDAASCALFFALCVGANALVSRIVGLPAALITGAGWVCFAAALLLAFLTIRPVRVLLGVAIAANALWVAASVAVVIGFFGSMTAIGVGLVLAQAAVVEFLTLREWQGFKRITANGPLPA